MAATRIQLRSRPTKRPQVTGQWSTGGASFTVTSGKSHMPKLDEKGFPQYGGVTNPVSVDMTVVA